LVRAELERVLGSETFAQSESLKRFLRHVVEAKLGGREGELKEQVLGTEVFGRSDSYDPRIDPIVRVQATRLRSKLRDYYHAEGARSDLTIELPKGSYVPSFARNPSGDEKAPNPWGKTLPVTAVTVGLLVLLGSWWLWKRGDRPPSPAPRSVAVLPFTDMSPGGDHEYFGDGLAEEITTALASIDELDVVPRTNAFRFKGENASVTTIASALGCEALLQGSVRVSDEKLRVQAQLLRASSGQQLWTETYDRPLDDAFAVQEEIARAVARAVEKKLADPQSADRRRPSPRAYDDFLRGTFERERHTPHSLARSIQLVESAIEEDPDFAPAHAGLVHSYVLSLLWGFAPPSETRDAAREASERALALGGDQEQALAAAASYRLLYDWDIAGAEALLERGDGEETRIVRAVALAARGKLEEAAREIDRARSRSRQRPLPHYLGAVIAFQRGEYESALERSRAILDWAPDHALTWLLLSRIQDRLGRFAEAEASLSSFEASAQAPVFASAYRAIFRSHQGRSDEAAVEVLKLEELRAQGYVPPALLSRVYASRSEEDEALRGLEAAEAEHSFSLVFLAVDPDFEPLRPNPRFRALIERLGLVGS
jgi:serine/threonine-protein kinase